ncbi:MAG: elongation factor P [Planctomycetota bacterium]|nr:elongation factor P [Planctomycetota bacterium]
MNSTDLRPGMAIKMDGNLWLVTEYNHVTPGNLRAFVQIKIKNLLKGQLIDKRLRSGESVEIVDLDRRTMTYLYAQAGKHCFMDDETFDQVELSANDVGELALYILPNTQVVICWCDGKAVSVELPNVVELLVAETSPGIKGATATNQLKEATMETGLNTRVPSFIAIGEKLRINTTDGTYASRA